MQTFLPYRSFEKTAAVLDWRRLGNQRNEADRILDTLNGVTRGWRHHPAVRMWEGYTAALRVYRDAIVIEWIRRGYENNLPLIASRRDRLKPLPPWLGLRRFHSSHRAALLHKLPEWYSQFGWREEPAINYVWPEVE